LYQATFPISE
jgi:DNA-binding MarR family transcriptional regulator